MAKVDNTRVSAGKSHRRFALMLFLLPWLVLAIGVREAVAHGAPLDRRVGWADWNWDVVILLNLALAGWLYARGLKTIWRRTGPGRVVTPGQAWCFLGGLLMVGVAVISPLDLMSDQLAWAHMVQHMLLMTVAAPLLVLGSPGLVGMWGLSREGRRFVGALFRRGRWTRRIADACGNPLAMWSLYAFATWGWHIPWFYNAALTSAWVHDLQHLSFFVAAVLFWRVLIDPLNRLRLEPSLAILALFTTTLHATVLGVLMTIAPDPWYTPYDGRTQLWGLSPLEDQQLAGLIMWMPACASYLAAAIVLLLLRLEGSQTAAPPRFSFTGKVTK